MTEISYRQIISDEYAKRLQINPRYSLRAFARDLEIQVSSLSSVLNAKKGLSRLTAKNIGRKLFSTPERVEWFCDLVDAESARSLKRRELARLKLANRPDATYKDLSLAAFRIISDWYHLAMLEMFKWQKQPSPLQIARQLGISHQDVDDAIARMLQLELITVDEKGRYIPTDHTVESNQGDGPHGDAAIRKFHQQILTKALTAINGQSVGERALGTMVLSVKQSDIPLAMKKLKAMRREFDQTFNRGTQGDAVYCLSMQYFALTEQQ